MCHIIAHERWHTQDVERSIERSYLESAKCVTQLYDVVLRLYLDPEAIDHEVDIGVRSGTLRVNSAITMLELLANMPKEPLSEGIEPE